MALKNNKYPWHTLKKVGDTFILDTDVLLLRQAAKIWGDYNGVKLKVHKAKGGSLVVRIG